MSLKKETKQDLTDKPIPGQNGLVGNGNEWIFHNSFRTQVLNLDSVSKTGYPLLAGGEGSYLYVANSRRILSTPTQCVCVCVCVLVFLGLPFKVYLLLYFFGGWGDKKCATHPCNLFFYWF